MAAEGGVIVTYWSLEPSESLQLGTDPGTEASYTAICRDYFRPLLQPVTDSTGVRRLPGWVTAGLTGVIYT